MVTFSGQAASVEKNLFRLAEITARLGGRVDDRLVLTESDGCFSAQVDSKAGNEAPLVTLSADCLLPLAEFSLVIQDGTLSVGDRSSHWSPERSELLDAMVDLYNGAGLMKSFRHRSPLFAADPGQGIRQSLLNARSPRLARVFIRDQNSKGPEQTLISRFLAGRAISGNAGGTLCLAPFLDLFAHHDQGAMPTHQGGGLVLGESHPVKGSRECFRRHGNRDALDLLLDKGVVSNQTQTVLSIPMRIELPGLGVIEVLSEPAPIEAPLEEAAKIPEAAPPPAGFIGNTATLPRLVIGGPAQPRILIRTLGVVLRKMAERQGRRSHRDHLKLAEAQVILGNRLFYERLSERLRNREREDQQAVSAFLDSTSRVLEHQRAVLRDYRMVS